ncbi:hypothetical protein [Pseudorhodoferax sp. Leaf274]|uniref:hypothetical protein n=1 Tax=Pseudorhodoferax sp. Leaf274 TaxID=1736318 RepID=UPI0007029047|nr:hypothetical protein [Pseudorhodoferax sp. Leaf274]KQP43945.1 hypothetical protein ASF44_28880 [Pseudorhodoferax sp. Leaf274]
MIADVIKHSTPVATHETVITWDTPQDDAREKASRLALVCTDDIDEACSLMLHHAARLRFGSCDEAECASALRLYAVRIKQLNRVVADHLGVGEMLLRDAYIEVHGTFPAEGELP